MVLVNTVLLIFTLSYFYNSELLGPEMLYIFCSRYVLHRKINVDALAPTGGVQNE